MPTGLVLAQQLWPWWASSWLSRWRRNAGSGIGVAPRKPAELLAQPQFHV
jgi:hypothetical protein